MQFSILSESIGQRPALRSNGRKTVLTDNSEARTASKGWASRLARIICGQVIPRNPEGFTFNPRREKCLPLSRNTNPKVYVVSIKGHELRLPHLPTELELFEWIVMRQQWLLRENYFIGGWPYFGNYFLDISILVSGKTAAESFARQQGQLGIYHPASGQSLEVTN